MRVLIVGLACGMLAHQVFGITDAFMLGTKLGAVMWVFFGLVAALYLNREKMARQELGNMAGNEEGENSRQGQDPKVGGGRVQNLFGSFWLAFVYWALFSLLAIAFIGAQPYLGLAIALVGAGILGFICISSFESRARMRSK